MDVKGEALLSIPIFIYKKFGQKKYEKWLMSLSPAAKKVYGAPINKNMWFPLKELLDEPTFQICALFFNNSLRGAWECGRYSAEFGLKGIYKILVKLSTPQILIKKAGPILMNYYRPSALEVVDSGPKNVVVRINHFPEMTRVIEHRIGGWMERAIEICGTKNVSVRITKSLTERAEYTEYNITWRTKL